MKESKKRALASCHEFSFSSDPDLDDPIRDSGKELVSYTKKFLVYESYYYGGDDLRIYPLTSVKYDTHFKAVLIPYPGLKHPALKKYGFVPIPYPRDYFFESIEGVKNPWNIFYTHCLIKNVILPMSLAKFPEEPTQAEIKKVIYSENKVLLNLVRDKPSALYNKGILDSFINILEEATRYKKREEILLLLDHLIPQNPGGKKLFRTPYQCKFAIDLAKKLAKHLSDKCKAILKMKGIEVGKKLEYENDVYKILHEWTTKNHEPRIDKLPEDSLKDLILHPSKFVENLISKELHTSSKTLTGKRF